MPLREDLLNPISEENPGGRDLRYDPIYDQIKEARRQDDELSQGVWTSERKVADYPQVIRIAQDAIATQSKDLQLAAWLTEAMLKAEGFSGLLQGLQLCYELVDKSWDHLFPELEDGEAEIRATPLEWIGNKLDTAVREAPLNVRKHSFFQYKESRTVGYEAQATNDAARKAREKLLKDGKMAPEVFDAALGETPKSFYASAEKSLDASLKLIAALGKLCDEKFGSFSPSFNKLTNAVTEVRHTVHAFLDKKRETDPDPVEEAPVEESAPSAADATESEANGEQQPVASGTWVPMRAAAEPAGRAEAIQSVVAAAAYLRQKEPSSPAPYLMLRGLRFGELRAAAARGDQTAMEAPPTEVRQQIKRLALNHKWKDLIETAESLMALPCSRAWLDLQRFVVEACIALGQDYHAIALAIRSELRALLRDVPELLDARLMDDTAAANVETQAWLKGLIAESNEASPSLKAPESAVSETPSPGWQKNFIDSYTLAAEALRAGQAPKAFELMFKEVERQRSGRGRFRRKLQLVELCVSAGKDTIAQPMLEDLTAAIDNHKLEEWEDREMIAAALATILRTSKKIQADAKEKQKMFERICRLDPVQALTVS